MLVHRHILRDASYRRVLQLQRDIFSALVGRRRQGLALLSHYILMVEHRPVYTLGRHGHRENLINPAMLRDNGIELVEIERGGDITFHGPGQLVVYPIIDLQHYGLGVKDYISLLEQAVIDTVAAYGITGKRIEGATGVWVDTPTGAAKICAIGVRCSRFITMHGLALNVSTPLRYFSAINPCGFTDRGVTSIAELLHAAPESPSWESVADSLFTNLLSLLHNSRNSFFFASAVEKLERTTK